MVDRGIIFSGPMVVALLDGRKRQTRRLIKPVTGPVRSGDVVVSWPADEVVRQGLTLRPPHAPGDRLYVRENFHPWTGSASRKTIVYVADGEWIDWGSGWRDHPKGITFCSPITPCIHMPRWASRLWLAVEDVRFQRVQDISREDCAAEGHPRSDTPGISEEAHLDAARDWFMDLWDSLHRKPGERWADNPWIVRTAFAVHKGNIDAELQSRA